MLEIHKFRALKLDCNFLIEQIVFSKIVKIIKLQVFMQICMQILKVIQVGRGQSLVSDKY